MHIQTTPPRLYQSPPPPPPPPDEPNFCQRVADNFRQDGALKTLVDSSLYGVAGGVLGITGGTIVALPLEIVLGQAGRTAGAAAILAGLTGGAVAGFLSRLGGDGFELPPPWGPHL